ncbi:zinc metalloprotease HtpX [candidate division KSB1 bacterium]
MNGMKTAVLMAFLTALLVGVGNIFGGQGGMIIAFTFAIIMNFSAYWFSDKMVLKMYKAREVGPDEAPDLYRSVQTLATNAGLPMPRVYIIPNQQPNAFATGRNPENAAVAVTEGIMRVLKRHELEGVIGHELAHIKNRDILIGTIAATIAGAISMLANMAQWAMIFGGGRGDDDDGGGIVGLLATMILAPIAAMMIQMAISRSREYAADDLGSHIAGNPMYLSGALRKLDAASKKIPMKANPSTAHMFIVNPLKAGGVASLFSTHPPMEKRIARLENLRLA